MSKKRAFLSWFLFDCQMIWVLVIAAVLGFAYMNRADAQETVSPEAVDDLGSFGNILGEIDTGGLSDLIRSIPVQDLQYVVDLPQLGHLELGFQPNDVDCVELLPAVQHALLAKEQDAVIIGVWFNKERACKVYDISSLRAIDNDGHFVNPHEAFEEYLHLRRFEYEFIKDGAVVRVSTP